MAGLAAVACLRGGVRRDCRHVGVAEGRRRSRPLYFVASIMVGYNVLFYLLQRHTSIGRGQRRTKHLLSKSCSIWFR